jgi:hypothetical protein
LFAGGNRDLLPVSGLFDCAILRQPDSAAPRDDWTDRRDPEFHRFLNDQIHSVHRRQGLDERDIERAFSTACFDAVDIDDAGSIGLNQSTFGFTILSVKEGQAIAEAQTTDADGVVSDGFR